MKAKTFFTTKWMGIIADGIFLPQHTQKENSRATTVFTETLTVFLIVSTSIFSCLEYRMKDARIS